MLSVGFVCCTPHPRVAASSAALGVTLGFLCSSVRIVRTPCRYCPYTCPCPFYSQQSNLYSTAIMQTSESWRRYSMNFVQTKHGLNERTLEKMSGVYENAFQRRRTFSHAQREWETRPGGTTKSPGISFEGGDLGDRLRGKSRTERSINPSIHQSNAMVPRTSTCTILSISPARP